MALSTIPQTYSLQELEEPLTLPDHTSIIVHLHTLTITSTHLYHVPSTHGTPYPSQ